MVQNNCIFEEFLRDLSGMTSSTITQAQQDQKLALRYEFIAICAVFFVLGFNFSTWASRIPAIRDSALLIPATLGYALLARGIGSVVMMPLTAWLIQVMGARKTGIIFGWIVALSLLPIAFSPNWIMLAVSMIIMGASGGGFNLAINALGASYEKRSGQPRMSTIHSWFGVGNLTGAVLGTFAAGLLISAQIHMLVITALMILVVITAFRFIPKDAESTIRKPGLEWPERPVLWLGAIIFMAACTEASIMNWVALFYSDYLKTGEGLAAIGYTTYAVALLMMRFTGDRLRARFGSRNLITFGTLFAAGGIILAILAEQLWVSSVGIFAMGLGVALTFPFIFSITGKISPNALATVMILGGVGELISQPIMGVIVQNFQLDGGFYTIAGIILLTSLMAWNSKLLKEN